MTADELQQRLARVIRFYRERLGASQEGFADDIDVHRTYYGAVERGRQNVTLRRLKQISDGLGVPLSRLFADAETKRDSDFPKPRGPGRPKSPPRAKRAPKR